MLSYSDWSAILLEEKPNVAFKKKNIELWPKCDKNGLKFAKMSLSQFCQWQRVEIVTNCDKKGFVTIPSKKLCQAVSNCDQFELFVTNCDNLRSLVMLGLLLHNYFLLCAILRISPGISRIFCARVVTRNIKGSLIVGKKIGHRLTFQRTFLNSLIEWNFRIGRLE